MKESNIYRSKLPRNLLLLLLTVAPISAFPATIDDAIEKTLLGTVVPSVQDVEDFVASGGCAGFQSDLQTLVGGMFGLADSLVNFNHLPSVFVIQDPGLADLIPIIPCELLLPVALVAQKLPLFDPEFLNEVYNAGSRIDLLKTIVFPSEVVTQQGQLQRSQLCVIVAEAQPQVTQASYVIRGLGMISAGIGTLFQAIGKTALAGPDETKVAIWGWVGTRIRNTPAMTVGNFLKGSGDALLMIGSAAASVINHCELRDDHIALQQDHLALQHELSNLLGQQKSLQDGQLEIIRLLLTPQGRRSSDFCHTGLCESRDFPVKVK